MTASFLLPSFAAGVVRRAVIPALLCQMLSAAPAVRLEEAFKKPPLAMKTVPLWHLNGTLTTAGIEEQLRDSRDRSGFAGVAVLPVSATVPKYLSEEYFARYGDILGASKRLGLKVVFYDDVDFPSGSAGGLMAKRFPEDRTCRLDKAETGVSGPLDWKCEIPAGIFMGAVAMKRQTLERIDISSHAKDGRIAWQVPAGEWQVMIFTCTRSGRNVDYLEPQSIAKFFSLTYDEYYRRFPDHFGTTIGMTFFDDVGVRRAERRDWTPAFNDKFKVKHGFSPVVYYPALWHDIGPDTAAARVALFGFRAELLAEGYPRMVHEWAAKHGLKSSGHAMGQYHPQPAFLGGDHLLFYRHSDIPMMDSIHYYGHGRPGFKLTSSAAVAYDRPLTAVEIYGNYKQFDPVMLYRSGMELFARGANLFLPHGMWYDPEKVRIKPLISHFDPVVGPVLPAYNDWAGRCSLLLQGGRPVVDIGVLYPVASMQAFARLDAAVDQPKVTGNVHPGLYQPPHADFNQVSDFLTGALRRDFTFLHPDTLDGRCAVRGAALHLENQVNFQDYRVVIVPGCDVIHWSNLKKLREFCAAGGKLIATSVLPGKSAELGHDGEVQAIVRELFEPALKPGGLFSKRAQPSGGAAYFVPSPTGESLALAAALQDAMPAADVGFADPPKMPEPDQGMLSYLHKESNGRQLYFFANSTDRRLTTTVSLRGKLTLEAWNPHDGGITSVKTTVVTSGDGEFTRATLDLQPVKSVFFVAVPQAP